MSGRPTSNPSSNETLAPGWPPPVPVSHPQFPGGARAAVLPAPDDDELATAQTVSLMQHFADVDAGNEIVRQAAHQAAAMAKGSGVADLLAAVHTWIKNHVRYQTDDVTAAPITNQPDQAEILIRPIDLLTMPEPAGDCDDYSMLCSSMLRSLGIPSSFRTVAADPEIPDRYTHVYTVAHTSLGDIPLDTSHGPQPGWEVPPAGKVRTWRPQDLTSTLGAIDWNAIVKASVDAGTKIAVARYGNPPAGTYQQTGDSVYYRQPAGSGAFAFPGASLSVGTGGISGGMLLLGGLAVFMVIFLNRK